MASATVTWATSDEAVAQFHLAANGVTVMCSDADVGQTGVVGGITYTKRSRVQIDALVDAEDYAPLVTTCTSGIWDMGDMFENATAFDEDISSWDVSSVWEIGSMFYNANAFNQDIGSWDVSKVLYMDRMFQNATAFNQDINSWDVSRVTTMRYMFT